MTRLLTTREAAEYCGYKTSSALRKAKAEGRIAPVTRRAGRGTWLWDQADLDRFLLGGRPASVEAGRPGAPPKEPQMDKKWICRWNKWVKPTRLPGVWRMKEGGYLVRARVTDPTTDRLREIKRVLREETEAQAFTWLEDEKQRIRAGLVLATPQSVRFCDYAVSVLENKVAKGELSTRASHDRWKHTLEHLIEGTSCEDDSLSVSGFGEFFVSQIRTGHVETWKVGVGKLIRAGHYSPNTANSWLAVLRGVLKSAKRDFELPSVATDGVSDFDTKAHATYTEEEPNSLALHEVPLFLEKLREMFPQHFAMAYLGLATGLRPSSLRPLRRSGDTPDIQWEAKRLLIRRSQVRGNSIRNTTKQGVRYAIDLPGDVIEVLRWHADTQLETDEQKESELLFPALHGGFRATTVLGKPFAIVSREIELGYDFTPRGMRRTFNDLARAAKVEDLVTRSISGHLTERMQHHYSTVRGDEQRQAVAKVIDLMTARSARASAAVSAAEPEHHSGPGNTPSEQPLGEPSGASGGATHMASGAIATAGQSSHEPETSKVGTP